MAWPTKKIRRVTCPYGTKGSQWLSGWHQGVDIGAPIGDPVFAAANGVVVGVGIWGPAFGKDAVVIRHKFRLRSFYCVYGHMSAHTVVAGEFVKLGQKVGEVGVEGNAHSGPHLHFEAQKTANWQVGGGVNPRWMLTYRGVK
jgi:murein DD-endopeptidase MepM/ murein hydrolase activator NlpD